MKLKEFVRNPYNYDVNEASDESGLECKDPSLTAQEFVRESDINYIAEQFLKTGEVKKVVNMPRSGDFSGVFDFQSSMNLIKRAKDEFAQLPAKVRSRFDNDPAKLIDFLDSNDENNRAEAIALGLVKKPEPINEARTEGVHETTSKKRSGAARTEEDPPAPERAEEPRPKTR